MAARSYTPLNPPTFAGYESLQRNPTEAQGSFVLPSFTCTKSTQWLDLSMQINGTPDAVAAYVYVTCNEPGVPPTYEGFACAGSGAPCSTDITPVPGDSITITDTLTASQSSALIDDVTANATASQTGSGATSYVGSSFFAGRLSGQIPSFTKVKFTDCTIDGKPIGAKGADTLNMGNKNGMTQVKAGALNGTGDGFALTFEHH